MGKAFCIPAALFAVASLRWQWGCTPEDRGVLTKPPSVKLATLFKGTSSQTPAVWVSNGPLHSEQDHGCAARVLVQRLRLRAKMGCNMLRVGITTLESGVSCRRIGDNCK